MVQFSGEWPIYICLLLTLLFSFCGEINTPRFPCWACTKAVRENDYSIACDNCDGTLPHQMYQPMQPSVHVRALCVNCSLCITASAKWGKKWDSRNGILPTGNFNGPVDTIIITIKMLNAWYPLLFIFYWYVHYYCYVRIICQYESVCLLSLTLWGSLSLCVCACVRVCVRVSIQVCGSNSGFSRFISSANIILSLSLVDDKLCLYIWFLALSPPPHLPSWCSCWVCSCLVWMHSHPSKYS